MHTTPCHLSKEQHHPQAPPPKTTIVTRMKYTTGHAKVPGRVRSVSALRPKPPPPPRTSGLCHSQGPSVGGSPPTPIL